MSGLSTPQSAAIRTHLYPIQPKVPSKAWSREAPGNAEGSRN